MKKSGSAFLLAVGLSLFGLGVTGCQAQQESKENHGTASSSPSIQADPVRNAAAGIEQINAGGAEKLISENTDLQILDVRTPQETASGTIAGAKIINLFDNDFEAKAGKTLDKSKPVLVYCKVGGRSAQAATKLEALGFTHIYNLQGGMNAWTGAGKPVQK
jgi:rhodanese-related sulfurtransferase